MCSATPPLRIANSRSLVINNTVPWYEKNNSFKNLAPGVLDVYDDRSCNATGTELGTHPLPDVIRCLSPTTRIRRATSRRSDGP